MNESVWLVCDRLNSVAFVADGDKLQEAQAFYQSRVHRPVGFVVADLPFLRQRFRDLVGPETRTFNRAEVAAVVGTNKPVIFNWVQDGLIRPSIRPRRGPGRGNAMEFSWHDAFVAAVLGTLARAGCNVKTLGEVSKLLYGGSKTKRKQAEAERVATEATIR